MRLITRDTDYAIRALLYLGENRKRKVSTSELAKELNIPRSFLRKILHILQREKILKSTRGNKGGFFFNCSPAKISLIKIINIYQEEINFTQCIFKKQLCINTKTCPLRRVLKDIENYVRNRLQSLAIGSLLKMMKFQKDIL